MSKYSLAQYVKPLGKFKNGKLKFRGKTYYKWFTEPHNLVLQEKFGEYQNIKLTKFEATDAQIKAWLDRKYSFKFSTYTEKGNVKVDRKQLKALGDYGKDLATLIKLKKDISQLGGTESSLIQKFNPETHAIHGRIDTLGAATHRCLPLDYKIKTLDGYKLWSELQVGQLVYTVNFEGVIVLSPLTAVNRYNSVGTQRISNGSLYFDSTLNHKWVTDTGFIETQDIKETTNLLI